MVGNLLDIIEHLLDGAQILDAVSLPQIMLEVQFLLFDYLVQTQWTLQDFRDIDILALQVDVGSHIFAKIKIYKN